MDGIHVEHFEKLGVSYIGMAGFLRKVENGKVYDMDRETREWVFIPEMSINQ